MAERGNGCRALFFLALFALIFFCFIQIVKARGGRRRAKKTRVSEEENREYRYRENAENVEAGKTQKAEWWKTVDEKRNEQYKDFNPWTSNRKGTNNAHDRMEPSRKNEHQYPAPDQQITGRFLIGDLNRIFIKLLLESDSSFNHRLARIWIDHSSDNWFWKRATGDAGLTVSLKEADTSKDRENNLKVLNEMITKEKREEIDYVGLMLARLVPSGAEGQKVKDLQVPVHQTPVDQESSGMDSMETDSVEIGSTELDSMVENADAEVDLRNEEMERVKDKPVWNPSEISERSNGYWTPMNSGIRPQETSELKNSYPQRSDDGHPVPPARSNIPLIIFWLIISMVVILGLVVICFNLKCCCFVQKPAPERDFCIDFSQLEIIERVGSGNFTHVYSVDYQPTFAKVSGGCFGDCCPVEPEIIEAAAKLLVPELTDPIEKGPSVLADSVHCSVDEIVLRKLKHKNIVKIYGICKNFEIQSTGIQARKCKTVATILEYMNLGNCRHYFLKMGPRSKNHFFAIFSILLDVISAFVYLADQHIVHRDLASRNILLTDIGDPWEKCILAKVADFGLAKEGKKCIVRSNYKFWAYIGSGHENLDVDIMAPEAKQDALFTSASDVYAFGILIFELIALLKGARRENVKQVCIDHSGEKDFCVRTLIESQPLAPYTQVRSIQNHFGINILEVDSPEAEDSSITSAILGLKRLAELCWKVEMGERITFKDLEQEMQILAAKYREDLKLHNTRDALIRTSNQMH